MAVVRKLLIVVLGVILLVPGSFISDVVRLPSLISHYFHHRQVNGHVHLSAFIAQHYSGDKHHDEDHDNHHNLPFHDHDVSLQQSFSACAILDTGSAAVLSYSIGNAGIKIKMRQHFYSSISLSSVWRPPKFT